VDSAIVSEDHDLLTVLGIGFLLLGLIQVGLTAGRSWLVTVLGTSANYQLLSNLFHHLLHLPMSFFEKRHLGERGFEIRFRQRDSAHADDGVSRRHHGWRDDRRDPRDDARVQREADRLRVRRRAALRRASRHPLPPLRSAQEEQILHAAKQNSTFLETVRGIQSVKLFNRQVQRRTLYQNRLVDHFNAGIRIQQMGIVFKSLNRGLFCVENVAVIWVGALLVIGGAACRLGCCSRFCLSSSSSSRGSWR